MFVKNFFIKLSSGDFGLAKTYWLYWVLALVAANIVMAIVPMKTTLILIPIIIMVASVAYLIPVAMGVWRAANQYEGRKIWAILATTSVVLGIIIIISMLIMFSTLIWDWDVGASRPWGR